MNAEETLIDTLYYSAVKNNISLLKRLEMKGVDIHYENDKAFLLACQYGHIQIIDYLLSKGANINTNIPEDGVFNEFSVVGNGLLTSSKNCNWETFDYLLSKNIKVDLDKSSVLKELVQQHDIGRVKKLIEKGASVNDSDSLSTAIITEALDIAKYFITEVNADIHIHGDFALRSFCLKGNLEMVKLLVEKGANINAGPNIHADENEYGYNETALTCAIANESWEVFNYLIANGADPNINKQEPFINAAILNGYSPKHNEFLNYYINNELVEFNNDVFEALVRADRFELLKFFLTEYSKVDIDKDSLLQNDAIYKYERIQMFDYLLSNGYQITDQTRNMLVREKKTKFSKILLTYDLSSDLNNQNNISKKVKI